MQLSLAKYLFITILFASVQLKAVQLVSLNDFDRNELKGQAFELSSDQTIKIKAVGPKMGFRETSSFIWILDLKTRQPIWILDDAKSSRGDNRRLREYEDEVQLKKGAYIAYYAATGQYSGRFTFSIGDFFKGDGFSSEYKRSDLNKFFLKIDGDGKTIRNTSEYLEQLGKYRIVNLSKAEKSMFERIGLDVKTETEIDIYAVGEITRDGNYDAAWLKSISTGKKVWEMDKYETEYAGGGEKNRFFRGKIKLKKGKYVLNFATDDSHHYGNWNVVPPYDPEAWGVSIYVDNKANISSYDFHEEELKNTFIDLTGLGDNEYATKGFVLKKATDIRIKALGEGYRSDDLVDYGWIIDADSRRKVWVMDEYNTDHAGGASKNRSVDEVIHLDKGSYIVYFVTDGSHSYGDGFNSSRPYNPKEWGISLSGIDENFSKSDIEAYEKPKEKNVLVQIIRVRDHEYHSETLKLDKDSEIRVYAIGEGSHDMSDYGWIQNVDTGRRVWRMRYESTEHAGGARKNRLIDEIIRLKKGEYKVFFKTDDSHSFRDWNASPPHDQEHWGITLYSVK